MVVCSSDNVPRSRCGRNSRNEWRCVLCATQFTKTVFTEKEKSQDDLTEMTRSVFQTAGEQK